MRVIAFPYKGIAYNDSFYEQLEDQGVEVIQGHWEGSWLLTKPLPSDIIHIHWPSFLYESKGKLVTIFKSFIRFLLLIVICRIKTKNIWWTAHNLYPHQRSRFPIIDNWARRFLIFLCRGILVHGEEAKRLVLTEFPGASKKCHIIPHGNWISKYGPRLPSDQARQKIGIDKNNFVYLLFGQCQEYKKICELVTSFFLSASDDDTLVIAGRFNDDSYLEKVLITINNDPRVIVVNKFIPDEEVSLYLSSANAFCIPYKEILTSGSAMLAVSYGLPVISLSKGYLKDLIDDTSGILIPELSVDKLSLALSKAKTINWDRDLIIEQASNHLFSDAAKTFISNAKIGNFHK